MRKVDFHIILGYDVCVRDSNNNYIIVWNNNNNMIQQTSNWSAFVSFFSLVVFIIILTKCLEIYSIFVISSIYPSIQNMDWSKNWLNILMILVGICMMDSFSSWIFFCLSSDDDLIYRHGREKKLCDTSLLFLLLVHYVTNILFNEKNSHE